MDITWDDVGIFLAVAEAGSVSGAALQLKLGQPTISRRLAEMEQTIGARLFARGVAGATLTTAGERLLAPATRMAEWAGEVARAAEAHEPAPQGLVRLSASPYVCFDFALRLRPPRGKDLEVLEAIEFDNAAWVSAALAKKLPKRPRPQDVPWIGWAPPFEDLPPQPMLEAMIPGFVPAFTSDNFLVNLAAAEAGAGAIVLGRVTHKFSRARGIVPLDMDLGPAKRGVLCLVCAESALDIPRVRLVADALREQVKGIRAC